ncbi:MAG: flagellar basal-body MS-ring/collar protein FliF [Halothiobacillaceae bacterium]
MAENILPPNEGMPATNTTGRERPGWLVQLDQFTQSSSFRQIAALVGLAAVVAFMVTLVMWGRAPAMEPLYTNLDSQDSAAVADALRAAGTKFEIDQQTGNIVVPADQVHQARMQLAAQGLPSQSSVGLEMLQQDPSLGTSQFLEQARYNHALEVELARTITAINSIESARVHLAVPKQSVFVRDRQSPTASVTVRLLPGRSLERGQVQSIQHLVASAIPGMESRDVTVVNQRGDLLSDDSGEASRLGLTDRQFAYRTRVEREFVRRIEALLQPIVGLDKVRAQVSADIDFSEREGTSETFGPAEGALRSEQISEQDQRLGGAGSLLGVPGALANQPPGGGQLAPGELPLQPPGDLTYEEYLELIQSPVNGQRNEVRNYEVDRQLSHTRFAMGGIERLTVAVLVDEPAVVDEEGNETREAPTQAELDRITALVEQAIGLDNERGDRITVTSAPFVQEKIEMPEPELWEHPMFWSTLKSAGIGLALLIIFLMVVRPLLRALFGKTEEERKALPGGGSGDVARLPGATGAEDEDGGVTAQIGSDAQGMPARRRQAAEEEEDEDVPALIGDASYTDRLKQLRKTIESDPRAVATVVKQWTNAES